MMADPEDPGAQALRAFQSLSDFRERLEELASGVYADGRKVDPRLKRKAAVMLAEHATFMQRYRPGMTELMVRWAYANPVGEVRAAARAALLSMGALTAGELTTLTQEAARRLALQRLTDTGWTDPTGLVG
jgi:hypothetical protein